MLNSSILGGHALHDGEAFEDFLVDLDTLHQLRPQGANVIFIADWNADIANTLQASPFNRAAASANQDNLPKLLSFLNVHGFSVSVPAASTMCAGGACERCVQ